MNEYDRIFRQLNNSISNIDRRLRRLEEKLRFDAGKDWMPANWWGRTSPTQPASRILNVRGGYLWVWNSAAGTGVFRRINDGLYDFGTVAAFTAIPSGYRWVVLQANMTPNPPTLRIYDSGEEFADYESCELDFWTDGASVDLYGGYIPLCAVVLRNNGTLDAIGGIENITLADREQSYLLVKDFRPWIHLHETGA